MSEPTRCPRPSGRDRARRRLALAAAGVLLLVPVAAPALALGEDGPFPLPLVSEVVPILPGGATAVDLPALVQDDLEAELDLPSARLEVPDGLPDATIERVRVGEDGLSYEVAGEGTWTLRGSVLAFEPEGGTGIATTGPALTIASTTGVRSEPTVLVPQEVPSEDVEVRAPARETVRVPLAADVPEGGDVRLDLDGLVPGASLREDGRVLVVPEQGTWHLDEDDAAVVYTPGGTPLGFQVAAPRYVVRDADGTPVATGRIRLEVPIIADAFRSAPYGEDILFTIAEHQQFVDLGTLQLRVPAGVTGAQVDEDRTVVEIPDQGRWTLDREAGTVGFSPASDDVTVAAPIAVTGTDERGNVADRGYLDPAYPVLADRAGAATPGSPVVLDLTRGANHVLDVSLGFTAADLPDGASVSGDGLRAEVPGEGTWELDPAAQEATFTPEEGFVGVATPVTVEGEGIYAAVVVRASLGATISPVVPTARTNEARTGAQQPVTVDVLANDTAGSGSQPLVTSSVLLRSLSATNLHELEDGTGRRLVIPDEGTYVVGEAGAVTFTPAEGFTGTTTAVDYTVVDSAGVPVSAQLVVVVDPFLVSGPTGADTGGINTLLAGILPSSPNTSLVFGTLVLLLVVGGGVSLAIGLRMERERRAWGE